MPKQAIAKLKIELAKRSLRLLDVYRFKNKDLLRVLDLARVVERIVQALKEK